MSEFLSKKLGAPQALMLGIPPTEWLIAGVAGVVDKDRPALER
jgi:hypothetical protein